MRAVELTKLTWRMLFLMVVVHSNTSLSQSAYDDKYYYPYNGTVYDYYCFRTRLSTYPRRCGLYNAAERAAILVFCTLESHIGHVALGVSLVFGTPGNVLILVLAFKLPLKPSSIYIGTLALADLLVLLVRGVDNYIILKLCNRYNLILNNLFPLVSATFTNLSRWMVFLVILERFVSIKWSKYRIYTTARTVWSVLAAFIIGAGAANLRMLPEWDLRFYDYYNHIAYVIATLRDYIPISCTVLFTALTAKQFMAVVRNQSNDATTSISPAEADLTKTIIVVSFTSVLLLLCEVAVAIYGIVTAYNTILMCPLDSSFLSFFSSLSYALATTSFAIKFYVYFTISPRLRSLFFAILLGKRPKERKMPINPQPSEPAGSKDI